MVEEGAFLSGRVLWANWDVDEVLTMKERIKNDPKFLTMTLAGSPV